MPFIDSVAAVVVVATAIYFIVLAGAALFLPDLAKRFLLGFAASPRVHYLEQCVRLLVGSALIVHAPHMSGAAAFRAFGWVLLVTTVGLLLIPWRWHNAFARWGVPQATRYIAVIGLTSLALGGAMVMAVLRGNVA